jgi:hypothetical protein
MYEQNKKGIYAYFKNKNSLHLLAETPEILKDNDISIGARIGNKKYGIQNSGTKINDWGLRLILSWLLKDAYGKDDGVPNYTTIRSVGLLKELIAFDKDINTDRVSAMIMLMIYREDVQRYIDKNIQNKKSLSQDDFWDKTISHYYKNNASRRRRYAKKHKYSW